MSLEYQIPKNTNNNNFEVKTKKKHNIANVALLDMCRKK